MKVSQKQAISVEVSQNLAIYMFHLLLSTHLYPFLDPKLSEYLEERQKERGGGVL